MCGIAGIVTQGPAANSELFDALTMLQHRGQDAAGIITNDGHHLYLRKENGLVRDVFNADFMNAHAGVDRIEADGSVTVIADTYRGDFSIVDGEPTSPLVRDLPRRGRDVLGRQGLSPREGSTT